LAEMRLLLTNYPMQINFKTPQNLKDIVQNTLIVYDLLAFCRYKSLKEEIKTLASEEITAFENAVDILRLRQLFLKTQTGVTFGQHRVWAEIENLVSPSL